MVVRVRLDCSELLLPPNPQKIESAPNYSLIVLWGTCPGSWLRSQPQRAGHPALCISGTASLIAPHCGGRTSMRGGRLCCGLISIGCGIGPSGGLSYTLMLG